MRTLITGGAGFIGSYVGRALLARGDEVAVIDNLNDTLYPGDLKRQRLEAVYSDPTPELFQVDLESLADVEAVIADFKPEAILHFAALANPGRSIGEEVPYTQTNVLGTVSVLKAAAQHDVQHVVFAGSSSVYNDEQVPFTEDSYPLRPRSPYGASKAAAEVYLRTWNDLTSVPVTVLRFFSVYGPWGRPDMAPHIFAEQIIKGETLSVTKDERKRDFTYIDDVVPAVLAAVDKRLPGFEVLNIGRGEPHDFRDLIAALEQAAGKPAAIEDRDTPPGEMRVTYADVSKARKLLDYDPTTSLTDGASKLVTWLQNH